jgi:hypothetical protein
MHSSILTRRGCRPVAVVLLFGVLGCGSRPYPVRGTVTLEDGTPVTAGTVVFEQRDAAKPSSARGVIQSDGKFELSTQRPGDGVVPGMYRVLVAPPAQPPDQAPVRPPFDTRYTEFATSGLEYEVKAEPNDYVIRLAPRK